MFVRRLYAHFSNEKQTGFYNQKLIVNRVVEIRRNDKKKLFTNRHNCQTSEERGVIMNAVSRVIISRFQLDKIDATHKNNCDQHANLIKFRTIQRSKFTTIFTLGQFVNEID